MSKWIDNQDFSAIRKCKINKRTILKNEDRYSERIRKN